MKVCNVPIQLSRKYYKDAIRSFVDIVKEESGVCSAYTIGTVSSPGISDLDFLLCLYDTSNRIQSFESRLPSRVKELIEPGSILKVPHSHMKDVHIIDDFPLTHIWGKKHVFHHYQQREIRLCRVMGWLPERVVKLQRVIKANQLDVLLSLRVLRSTTYSLRILSNLTHTRIAHSFIHNVESLRTSWWSSRRRIEKLRKLIIQAKHEALNAIETCDEYATNNEFLMPMRNPHGSMTIQGGPQFYFGTHTSIDKDKLILPPIFYTYYSAKVALSQGWLHENLKHSFKDADVSHVEDCVSVTMRDVIQRRLSYVNEVAHFLRSHRIHRGLLKYGWFL